jgi:hypothetical protein
MTGALSAMLRKRASLSRSAALGLAAHARHLHVRVDTRQQLARAEGLGQVVIGAGCHALHTALLASAGREQDDGDVARARLGAQLAQQSEAVEARHHHVRQDEIGSMLARGRERRLAVGDGQDPVALGEQADRVLPHVGVVVGDEHARAPIFRARIGARLPARNASGRRLVGLRERSALLSITRQPAQGLLDEGMRRAARLGSSAAVADLARRQVRDPSGMRIVNVVPLADGALGVDRAAVQAHQLLHQRQSRCRCLRACGRRAFSTRWKRSNKRGISSGRDARARVRHAQLGRSVDLAQRDLDPASKVNLKALESRLSTTFSHISRSTKTAAERVAHSTSRRMPARSTAARKTPASSAVKAARSVG